MERKEILRRAQNQGRKEPDEMQQQVLLKSNDLALRFGLAFSTLLFVIKILAGIPALDTYAIFLIIGSVDSFYRWHIYRKGLSLFLGIFFLFLCAFTTVQFLLSLL